MESSLDDLLKSIRDEAKKESALVVMDGGSDKDEELVNEEIDERILRLLGIEDVFDIDYATYKTLLKERMMAARMSGSEIPTEEAEVITNEFKRVKSREGRFKVIRKKLSVGDIRKTSPLKGLGAVQENPQKLLAPAEEEKKLGPIDEIIKSLSNIVDILKERNSLLKKQSEKSRRESQNKQRADKEARAEAGVFGKVLEGAKKAIAPVQNILGKIFDIFMKIILGRFLIKFIDWFADPDNQGKINAIGRFLSDHWPKLLAAYLLFGTSLGRFVVRITATLVRGATTLLTKVLPQLFKFIKANPKLAALAAGAALFGAGAAIPALFPQTVEDDADKQSNKAAEEKGSDQAAKDIKNQKGNPILDFITGAGQERKEQAQRLETGEEKRYGFFGELAGGGQVSGPKGTDVIPARLTDGEFVMSKGAVDAFGTDFMESLNAAGGGNNRPKKSSGTIYAAGGGQIGARRGSGYGSPKGGFERQPSSEEESSPIEKKSLPGEGPGTLTPDSTRVEELGRKKKQGGESLGSATKRGGIPAQKASESSASKSSIVLALKDGIQGKLNTLTGKFTPVAFTDAERARYIKFGGEIPDSPKKPERNDFPMGRSGAKKYQESLKSFKESTTITTTPKTSSGLKRSDFSMGRSGAKKYQETQQSLKAAATTATIPTTTQTSGQAEKRHAELMKSTNPQRIADYDAKHGAGAYSKKLQEKLNKTYPSKAPQSKPQPQPQSKIIPTGKVVGRENLSPKAQKALARLDAQKAGGKTPDMQYTRNGKKISAEQFNKVESGNIIPGGGEPGGFLGGMMKGAKNMFGGMFGGMGKPPAPAPGQKVVDGNIGKPTAQEQRDIDALAAKKAKLKQSQQSLMRLKTPAKPSPGDAALKAEYDMIQNDPKHPLFEKVRGGSDLDDFGMRFSDFKKFKAQQKQTPSYNPKNMTPRQTSKLNVEPPPMKPPQTVVTSAMGNGGNKQSSPPQSNSLPEISASSNSTNKGRNTKLFGIF